MYEGPTIDMSSKYAALTKTMWLTSFYVCITPIGLIISVFNLIIVYWVDKVLKIFNKLSLLIIYCNLVSFAEKICPSEGCFPEIKPRNARIN